MWRYLLYFITYLLLSLIVTTRTYAFQPFDCATNNYVNGDCTGQFYRTAVDCGPAGGTTGNTCCASLGGTCQPACTGSLVTGPVCQDYSTSTGCQNASCGLLPVFCCNYSTSQPPAPNCIASDCNGVNCAASGQVCTITTNPCSCVTPAPPPAPTCSSTNCGACTDCGTCIAQSACGWTGSSCQTGTAFCPAGLSEWHWASCSVNVCQPPPTPPPPPPPSCPALTCTYSTPDSSCPSGYSIVTGNGCVGFNCGCSYVPGCSTSTCSPTPTPPPPNTCPGGSCSCAVSWNTPANPAYNTNVTVTVDGLSSNFGWTNVAYRLDGTTWNSNVTVLSSSIPRWQFSVPSGSSDVHTLQFSAKDSSGTTITCPPSSSFQK